MLCEVEVGGCVVGWVERESDGKVWFWTVVLVEVECMLDILPDFLPQPESESLARSSRVHVKFPVHLCADMPSNLNEVQVRECVLNQAQCGFHQG